MSLTSTTPFLYNELLQVICDHSVPRDEGESVPSYVNRMVHLRLTSKLFSVHLGNHPVYIGYGANVRKYVKVSLRDVTGWARYLLKEQCNLRVSPSGWVTTPITKIVPPLEGLLSCKPHPRDIAFLDNEDRALLVKSYNNSRNLLIEAFDENEDGAYYTLECNVERLDPMSTVRCRDPLNPTKREWYISVVGDRKVVACVRQ